jgi:LmbE family N-acetylglucosaminyl deacetylase
MLLDARRALLRPIVYPAVEGIWSSAFYLAGMCSQPRKHVRYLTFTGTARVGIVAPHPDDEVGGCGGVACLHIAAGDSVSVLVVTDGSASRAGGLGPGPMAARRAEEARAAASALGLTDLALAGLPEGAWPLAEGSSAISRWLAALQPAVVYAPSCVDYHPEHLRVARALAGALTTTPLASPPVIRVYELFVPLGPMLRSHVAGIVTVQPAKSAALACYRTQADGLAQIPRRDRYLARLCGLSRAAEGFCTLTAGQYAAMIAAGDWTGRPSPYRGLRGRPFSDPLAYLAGNAARRRLRAGLAGSR